MTRYYLRLPGHESVDEVRALAESLGAEIVSLELGPDGKIRGLALIKKAEDETWVSTKERA